MADETTCNPSWWKHTGTKVFFLFLSFLLAENVVLFYQVQRLKTSSSTIKTPSPMKVGDDLQSIRVIGMDGIPKTLNSRGKTIFIFTEKCPFCMKNFANWEAITSEIGMENVLYISTDQLPEARRFAVKKGLESRLLVLADSTEALRLKVFQVPQTIALSGTRVRYIHVGMLSIEQVKLFSQ